MANLKRAHGVSESPTDPNTGSLNEQPPPELLHVPDHLVCPLTLCLFQDPVMLSSTGHTFERQTIEGWLRNNNTNPITGELLGDYALVPNYVVREAVEAFNVGAVKRRRLEEAVKVSAISNFRATSSTHVTIGLDSRSRSPGSFFPSSSAVVQSQSVHQEISSPKHSSSELDEMLKHELVCWLSKATKCVSRVASRYADLFMSQEIGSISKLRLRLIHVPDWLDRLEGMGLEDAILIREQLNLPQSSTDTSSNSSNFTGVQESLTAVQVPALSVTPNRATQQSAITPAVVPINIYNLSPEALVAHLRVTINQLHRENDIVLAELTQLEFISFGVCYFRMDQTGVVLCRSGVGSVLALVLRSDMYDIPAIVVSACKTIRYLALSNAECEMAFGSEGACEALVPLLHGTHSANDDVMVEVCRTILCLATKDTARVKLGTAGVCEALVPLLMTHSTNADVMEQVCGAIGRLAADDTNKIKLRSMPLLMDLLNEVLANHSSNEAVCVQARRARDKLASLIL